MAHPCLTAARPPVVVGNRIKAERAKQKLSLRALADRSDIHHTYLKQIEAGERNPTLLTILAIAAALGVDADVLLKGLRAKLQPSAAT